MEFFDPFDNNTEAEEDSGFGASYRNGPTAHGTFVGTCKNCGIVWEFENYEVIPVPYPHGTCPNCHQWVAVF